jgi:hypothetical protein
MSSGPGIFVKAQIHLPEDDPAVFGLFVEWLYYGTYDDLAAPSSSNIHAQCWVLGDKLLCNEFKNYAMSRLYKQRLDFSMTHEDVEYAYANTSPNSKLRQFYVDFVKQNFSDPKKLRGPVGDWDTILQKDPDLRISLLLSIRQKPFCKCHLNDPKDYIDFDEVYFTAITPSAAEPIRLPVRKKKRKNKKPKCGANIKSEKNISENILFKKIKT